MFDLTRILANRRWSRTVTPFPHVVARDVLRPDVYASVEGAFRDVLARGLAPRWDGHRLCRSASGYDAFMLPFSRGLSEPLHLFFSRAWHDMIASVAGVEATGDVDGGLHHHAIGSASGWLHTDLSPGWFGGPRGPDGLRLSDGKMVEYATGKRVAAGVRPAERVRGAAMIFYLANGPWAPGEGGETGLFGRGDGPATSPAVAIPPLDNSLLVFECSPFSFHAFLHNSARPRNSVILWVHRSRPDAERRFGAGSIVAWRSRQRPAARDGAHLATEEGTR